MNRERWDHIKQQCVDAMPVGCDFDLNDLLWPVLKARPQAHLGKFLAEDVSAGLLPNVIFTGRKGINSQNIYKKM